MVRQARSPAVSVTTCSCGASTLQLTFEMIEIAFRNNIAIDKLLFGSKRSVLHNLVGYHRTQSIYG